jgi:riboflavin kinase/FMN adenylyltransferase
VSRSTPHTPEILARQAERLGRLERPVVQAATVHSRRIDGVKRLAARRGTTLVAIGNFDGVHVGHRAVLAKARELAVGAGLSLVVLTFDPHPAEVLGRGRQPTLTPLERKVELLCRLDPELRIVVEPFTRELSLMGARAFVEDLLLGALGAKIVVVGENFRFGRGREGDLSLLESLGKELGFEACALELECDGEGPISSSRIRAAIQAGDLHEAERLLGRPHAVSGNVERGAGRGRTIGVPTANMTAMSEAIPPHGVYACLVDKLVPQARVQRLGTGVANIGNRPTVGEGFALEVHVFDFHGDLYGQRLRLHLVERIRDVRRFESLDALKDQIRSDVVQARTATAGRMPDPSANGGWC